jgi:predicted glycoside hydrolase/deacetylase ChbG (UPF0249 family)
MSVIFNADDAGYAAIRDQGICRAITHGPVRAVSVLANGESAGEVRTWIPREASVGLHLNFTEGMPTSNPNSVPSLLQVRAHWPLL